MYARDNNCRMTSKKRRGREFTRNYGGRKGRQRKHLQLVRASKRKSRLTLKVLPASFFFGVRIWFIIVKFLGRFSINYFRGLGLGLELGLFNSVLPRFSKGQGAISKGHF